MGFHKIVWQLRQALQDNILAILKQAKLNHQMNYKNPFENTGTLQSRRSLGNALAYVRIRFPTTDVKHVIEDILRLKISYTLHEDYGFYSYTEYYVLGDTFILCSHEIDKGVLVELKGRGCRQFESYLLAQQRSWYEFLWIP